MWRNALCRNRKTLSLHNNFLSLSSRTVTEQTNSTGFSNTGFYITEKPKLKSFVLRSDGPINDTLQELFSRNLKKFNKIDYFSDHDISIWQRYSMYGLGISFGIGYLLAPVLGIFIGSYFTIVGGFLAQARRKYFGKPGEFLTSPAAELFENIISYTLITNAELAIEPWKDDLLEKYEPLIRSLTPYTSLQQLLVKEPIFDRHEKPRVVSASSASIIWKNLMEESVFHQSESNPWQSEFEKKILGKYLLYLKPRLHPFVVETKFGIEITIDKRLQSFDNFCEIFLLRSMAMLSENCNCYENIKRTNLYVFFSGVVLSIPLLLFV